MAELPSWPDSSTVIGAAGGFAGLGAIIKTFLDWRRDNARDRRSSEDEIRGDLREILADLRAENGRLQGMVATLQRDLRTVSENSQRRLRACEERAVRFQRELAEIKSQIKGYHHGDPS